MDTTRHKAGAKPGVLVVEDDDMVGRTLVAMLEDDYAPRLVAEHDSALAILRGCPFLAMVILDANMPGADVPELLAATDASGVPVLIISGDAQASERYPDRPFLAKPFPAQRLLAVMRVLRNSVV